MNDIFTSLSQTFSAQDATREKLRDRRDAADVQVRVAQRLFTQLHKGDDLHSVCNSVRDALKQTGPLIVKIEQELPSEPGAFYRYADIWHNQLQSCAMMAVAVNFIEHDTLANLETVVEMLGGDLRLTVEDYLMGVCNSLSELARLSVNRVIGGDYATPRRCARFGHDVIEGFKQLNLRNDFLRKRYDGIKYDVKRMEEILYDLSIRGLGKESNPDVNMTKDS